ncbi:hypothetical protein EDD85DRAFT_791185 [Armillaria nabsnona]|nr:hypothetical protein EDD85DRAFT_791185 [Armillaria nabsnona]
MKRTVPGLSSWSGRWWYGENGKGGAHIIFTMMERVGRETDLITGFPDVENRGGEVLAAVDTPRVPHQIIASPTPIIVVVVVFFVIVVVARLALRTPFCTEMAANIKTLDKSWMAVIVTNVDVGSVGCGGACAVVVVDVDVGIVVVVVDGHSTRGSLIQGLTLVGRAQFAYYASAEARRGGGERVKKKMHSHSITVRTYGPE